MYSRSELIQGAEFDGLGWTLHARKIGMNNVRRSESRRTRACETGRKPGMPATYVLPM